MGALIYFTGTVNAAIRPHLLTGELGWITTPQVNRKVPIPAEVRHIIADSGCFGANWPGEEGWAKWVRALPRVPMLTVAPDVVADAAATLDLGRRWLPWLREIGHHPCLVAQDGLTIETTPWDLIDGLFIGGSTGWKLSAQSAGLMAEAKRRGLWVHVGRVNSSRRFAWSGLHGADSVDGNFLAYGPKVNLPKIALWSSQIPLRSNA